MAERVCVGVVTGVHGTRGVLKVKSFTETPRDVAAYGPLRDERGRIWSARVEGEVKGSVLIRLDGVVDRTQAEALRGTRFWVDRSALPATEEDEFLHADLVGLRVETPDGQVLGTVRGVADFGAGDLLDIAALDGPSLMVPFTRAAVPLVDVAAGRLVVTLPTLVDAEDLE